MNLSSTDLNLFVVFDAIYSEGNLTRAGKNLGITQPAVSNALSRLRIMFDDPLFSRTAQGMKPTPAAQNIIVQVRQALHLLRNSIQESTHFQPNLSEKTFCFSMGDLEEAAILPKLFRSIEGKAPKVAIESFPIHKHSITSDLESGIVDFAINPPTINDAHLKHQCLFSEPYVCFVRRGHPVASKAFTLEAYLNLQHISMTKHRRGISHVDQALQRMGYHRKIALKGEHYLIGPDVVRQSDFAITMPRRLASSHPELVALELPFQLNHFELHLYWHDTAHKDPANIWMRDLIFDAFPKPAAARLPENVDSF